MGYQALLFCPDEKLARTVTQIFTDLEFQVEPVNEPFAAVKKLMAQRFDALVVDCENEQNATLLFKSARNSTFNQNSLALALVEGQAGVAKAYRIGANLVLTKPVNVEQAKGTLRVARGLLRKHAENTPVTTPEAPKPAVASAPTPRPVPVPPPQPKPVSPVVETPRPKPTFETPVFEPVLPAMAVSVEKAAEPKVIEPVEAHAAKPVLAEVVAPVLPAPEEEFKQVVVALPPTANPPAAAVQVGSALSGMQGAAAAAPAKEAPAHVEEKPAQPEVLKSAAASTQITTAPTFGMPATGSESSGGGKKVLAIAATLLVAGGLGFFAYNKFVKPGQSSAPVAATTQQPVEAQPQTVPAPKVQANVAPQTAPASSSAAVSQVASTPPATKPAASVPAFVTTKTTPEPPVSSAPTPIQVKTQAPTKKSAPVEEVAAAPNPLAVSSADTKNLAGIVSSAPAVLPKQSPSALRVSQGVSQGLLINKVQPKYPSNALAMRIQGSVVMEATINREGKITNIKVTSGEPVLTRAALDAVKQWRYRPYFLDGEPVEIQTQITMNFKLPN